VTYGVSTYGGIRAAMALRPFLAEIGTISVSKITAVPCAQDCLLEDGTPKDPEDKSLRVFSAMMEQVEFLALAVLRQRAFEATASP